MIGKGSFGVVYLSFEPSTHKKIAIKKVFQDIRTKNNEVCLLYKLNHPNIIQMIDNFTILEKGRMYTCIVSDYYDTDLLRLFLKRKRID
jgi:serine/threonine protein kinase